ncbi:hypothetical protein [Halomicronema sp. CCY15110]|uniref:hypothetical protein n=1 Tax=Halomicronema sp. CCY15110 TaxID=2767773 RepID=UPI00194F4114|nr:hypothetical protein [Halomicronema sp. CCY15110]
MAKLTLDIPDDLMAHLEDAGERLPELLQIALQLWQSSQQGQDVVVMAAGQEILHLPSQPAAGQPLPSRAELRSHQKLSKTSTLETLKQLREEARY